MTSKLLKGENEVKVKFENSLHHYNATLAICSYLKGHTCGAYGLSDHI